MIKVKNIDSAARRLQVSDIKKQEARIEFGEIQSFTETDEVVNSMQEGGGLYKLLQAGKLELIEPSERSDIDKVITWIKDNDVKIAFTDDPAAAGAKEGVDVELRVTDGDGTLDTFNSVATIVVTITGGTATNPKVDAVAGPVTKTFTNGLVEVVISADTVGTVILGLSGGNTTLDKTSTIIITLS